ncbi:SGNH/GDSL hydrolase family protein [Actinokineospora bangkokensis]|uniref:SGNH hydrolase-type esterase domain-containing protein n=1 Tax=Actinokineospora bangkokensis TaxID=1193682 RepID=A0A1Q9LIA1_9PSEU|nr:SGNH/GDSL hydrolase family protein [Actinokineospora bangkokensis]OLR91777.1 hypothetical protein BJP25_24975 [Actinokineospora bangkokensis]
MTPGARVLFVGNSFTYYHGMPHQLAALAAPDLALHHRVIAAAGRLLAGTWAEGTPTAALAEPWDHVVLQEQSTLGHGLTVDGVPRVRDPREFHAAVRAIVPEVVAAGARPALYLTWARRDDPAAQDQLDAAYTTIAAEVGAAVVPVGPAWRAALADRPDLVLHDEDGSHPNPAGSYLAACVFLAALLGLDPRGRAAAVSGPRVDDFAAPLGHGTLVDLAPADAAFLQDTAWRVTR